MVVEGCLHASDKNRWYRQHARHAYLINDIYIGIPLCPAECFDLRGLSIPCISSAGIWIYLRAVGLLILYLLQMSVMSFSGISFHWLCISCIIFCFFPVFCLPFFLGTVVVICRIVVINRISICICWRRIVIV